MAVEKRVSAEKRSVSFPSQTCLEVARDLVINLEALKPGESVVLKVERHAEGNKEIYDWSLESSDPVQRLTGGQYVGFGLVKKKY